MNHVMNPMIPYNGPISGGIFPGRTIKIHGSTYHHSHRFGVNLVCGAVGDVALHIGVNFNDHHIVRNSILGNVWGHAENHGHNPIHRGGPFEISVHVDTEYFRISINSHHFAEFRHRLPYTRVTNLSIEGEVSVTSIVFEPHHGGPGYGIAPPFVPPVHGGHPPHMGGHPPHMGGHPPHMGGHPPHMGGHPPHMGGHPPHVGHGNTIYPPGHHLAGHGSHGMHLTKEQKKAMKRDRKAQKKALKYGLGIGAVGAGAYGLHKAHHHYKHGHHGHHGGSSSSSSSSSSSD